MCLMTSLLLVAFAFASPTQQSEPPKQDKAQPTPTKQDKAQPAPTKEDKTKEDKAPADPAKPDKAVSDPAKPAQEPSPTPSPAPAQATAALDKADSDFLTDAAQDGTMEVQMGRLAVDKATNPDVKQFAQRLIDDHSKANSELMALASQKGLTLPATSEAAAVVTVEASPDQATATAKAMEKEKEKTADPAASTQRHARVDAEASPKDQKEISKLSELSGDAFDQEFIDIAVKGHEKDVKEFEKISTKAKDPDVQAFAAKTLPTLREHLQQARDLQSRLKATKK